MAEEQVVTDTSQAQVLEDKRIISDLKRIAHPEFIKALNFIFKDYKCHGFKILKKQDLLAQQHSPDLLFGELKLPFKHVFSSTSNWFTNHTGTVFVPIKYVGYLESHYTLPWHKNYLRISITGKKL